VFPVLLIPILPRRCLLSYIDVVHNTKSNSNQPIQTDIDFIRFLSVWAGCPLVRVRFFNWPGRCAQRRRTLFLTYPPRHSVEHVTCSSRPVTSCCPVLRARAAEPSRHARRRFKCEAPPRPASATVSPERRRRSEPSARRHPAPRSPPHPGGWLLHRRYRRQRAREAWCGVSLRRTWRRLGMGETGPGMGKTGHGAGGDGYGAARRGR